MLSTLDRVVDAPAYDALVEEVRFWLASRGRVETDLASLTDIPVEFVNRLVRGEPFPCSRAVATRIVTRMRAF
jgi:hypothetical protein